MMNTRITRVIKVEVTPISGGESCPSEVFHEISKEYGQTLDIKEIKRELKRDSR